MARPREFDPAHALEDLKEVFWRLGYDGASMPEIEAATGLNKQSLYRVFGDKRAMYLAALDAYENDEVAGAGEVLAKAGSARARFERLFAEVLRDADPRGCFLCNASADQVPHDDASAAAVGRMMNGVHAAFAGALAADATYRDDRARRDAKAAALMAGYFGLRTMIKAGQSAKRLKAAVGDLLSSI